MRIGIDARMSGPGVGGGGLGRYVEELVKWLPTVDRKNRFVLFQPDIRLYTLKEQLLLSPIIDKEKLDLVHFPHWNVPLFLKTPFVVTIHDLILLEEPRSARATTRHPLIYALKYAGFKRVLAHAVHASRKIIAVSEATKSDILKHFPEIGEDKVVVIYEGVTSLNQNAERGLGTPPIMEGDYLLYVGNAYPHKNLETLVRAFDLLHAERPNLHLIFAGRDDVFSRRLEKHTQQISSASFVRFIRDPDDATLAQLYANAMAYVFPSRIEGFGLPPLEAMSMGVPVACSDIPSLREILGDRALFFDPNDLKSIAKTVSLLLDNKILREKLIQKGKQRAALYSWEKMAEQTVNVYQSCAGT